MGAGLRALLERFSRGVVLSRRLPAELGGARLFVSPGSALRFWLPRVESMDPALLRAARELVGEGDVVWDVGASVGLFTFAAAGLSGPRGRVLAVEADPFAARLLRRSAAVNRGPLAPVDVLEAAATDHEGRAAFVVAARGRASSHIAGAGHSQTGGVRSTLDVPATTLDRLLDRFPPPAVLKIDVEGHEAAVLAGALRVLAHHRPRIHCEVQEATASEVDARLRRAGYVLYDAAAAPSDRRPLTRPAWNTLALPGAPS